MEKQQFLWDQFFTEPSGSVFETSGASLEPIQRLFPQPLDGPGIVVAEPEVMVEG